MKYQIVSALDDTFQKKGLLLKHLANLPKDEETINLVVELFERYESNGISERFALCRLEAYKHSYGLLIGLSNNLAMFWHPNAGHFWLPFDAISFEHEAAFLTGTSAPIIARPEVGRCYSFGKGVHRTIARPRNQSDALHRYRELVKMTLEPVRGRSDSSSEDGSDMSNKPTHHALMPDNGFSLLG